MSKCRGCMHLLTVVPRLNSQLPSEVVCTRAPTNHSFQLSVAVGCPREKEFRFIYPDDQADSQLVRLPVSNTHNLNSTTVSIIAGGAIAPVSSWCRETPSSSAGELSPSVPSGVLSTHISPHLPCRAQQTSHQDSLPNISGIYTYIEPRNTHATIISDLCLFRTVQNAEYKQCQG